MSESSSASVLLLSDVFCAYTNDDRSVTRNKQVPRDFEIFMIGLPELGVGDFLYTQKLLFATLVDRSLVLHLRENINLC